VERDVHRPLISLDCLAQPKGRGGLNLWCVCALKITLFVKRILSEKALVLKSWMKQIEVAKNNEKEKYWFTHILNHKQDNLDEYYSNLLIDTGYWLNGI